MAGSDKKKAQKGYTPGSNQNLFKHFLTASTFYIISKKKKKNYISIKLNLFTRQETFAMSFIKMCLFKRSNIESQWKKEKKRATSLVGSADPGGEPDPV